MSSMTYKAIAHELIEAQGETGGMYGYGYSLEVIDFGGYDFVKVSEPVSKVDGVVMLTSNPNLVDWITDLASLTGVRYSHSSAVRLAYEIYDEIKVRQMNG